MTVPKEYTNRKEEDMFKMDRSLAKGKFMLSKGNLKLRAGESTSSELIVTMAKDSWVEILSIGKEETIDGITSNWVQVSPVRNSVDANGKKVHYIVGWCFGGYLEKESESADAPATEERRESVEESALPEAAESESPNKEVESTDAPSKESADTDMLAKENADAKQNAALPILPIAAGVATFAILLAVILLAAKKRKAGKE